MLQSHMSTNVNGISPHRLMLYLLTKKIYHCCRLFWETIFHLFQKDTIMKNKTKKLIWKKNLLGTKFRENGLGN